MKKKLSILCISALMLALIITIGFPIWEKYTKQKRADEFYRAELANIYFNFVNKAPEKWLLDYSKMLEETEESMLKEGYTWSQVKIISRNVYDIEETKKRYEDYGYKDGVNGKEPQKDLKTDRNFGRCYRIGFIKGLNEFAKEQKK